jgi:anti-sigma regulatory factor (Ser/Thr protein kinase)
MMADPARLQQVVWNLLSNAVKFTPKDGQVRVHLRRRGSDMELRVSDTGKGIASSFLPHVFDPFRQEEGGTTRSKGGLGLGLAISKQLVELHGGSIQAASEGEGRGATFTVTLPIHGSPRPSPADGDAVRRFRDDSSFERPPQLRGLRVLVVDDEADVRQLVHAILDECGSLVTTASSAEEALDVLSRETPDVLISDIGMPGTDGCRAPTATSSSASCGLSRRIAAARSPPSRSRRTHGWRIGSAPKTPASRSTCRSRSSPSSSSRSSEASPAGPLRRRSHARSAIPRRELLIRRMSTREQRSES